MKNPFFLFILLLLSIYNCAAAEEQKFAQFAVDLPAGWTGDEQTGFISDNPAEYMLTIGKKDDKEEHFVAQISIYLLPNKPGTDSKSSAEILAEAQGETSEPAQIGNLWTFTGIPRNNTLKGKARTWVNATPEDLFIMIAQDPDQLGADQIVESLKGLTPRAKQLLGR